MRVAFDIDDTLWEVRGEPGSFRQVPDYDLIAVLRWHAKNGDEVFIWSAGGVDYARTIVEKLGLEPYIAGVLPKGGGQDMDLAYDDENGSALAKLWIRVRRPQREL